MGYRGKLLVEHTAIELPDEFVEKYKEEYYIGTGKIGTSKENTRYLNISSKFETKGHWDIISDLEELLKRSPFDVYAVVLWEDGKIDKYNLSEGRNEVPRQSI